MKEKSHQLALGVFIEEQLKCANLNINEMCKEIHMGTATYEELKKGDDKNLRHYARILDYYCDSLTEEEFLEKVNAWGKLYLLHKKNKNV